MESEPYEDEATEVLVQQHYLGKLLLMQELIPINSSPNIYSFL